MYAPLRSIFVLSLLAVASGTASAAPSRSAGPADGSGSYYQPAASSGPMGLSKFSLQSRAGEHGVSRLGVLLGIEHVTGWFSGSSNGPVNLDFVHDPLPSGSVVTAARRTGCTNSCNIGIRTPGPDEVFVLSGFSFDTVDGAAPSIHQIGVEPDPEHGRVVFTLSGSEAIEFDALLQYAYVPRSEVGGGRAFARTKSNPNGQRRTKLVFAEFAEPQGATLLTGFSLEFQQGSHRLHTIAVAMIRDAAVVLFNDATPDDAYTARVSALRLNSAN